MVKTLMVIAPYTGKPPVLNFDKIAAYIVQVFFKVDYYTAICTSNLRKTEANFRKLFLMLIFSRLLTSLPPENRELHYEYDMNIKGQYYF